MATKAQQAAINAMVNGTWGRQTNKVVRAKNQKQAQSIAARQMATGKWAGSTIKVGGKGKGTHGYANGSHEPTK